MNRKIFFLALGALLLAVCSSVEAQQPRVYSVGLVSLGSTVTAELSGIRDGLKDAGYIEGKNLLLDVGIAKSYDRLRPIIQSYIGKQFDIIVSTGASAPLVAKESTRNIPIVFIGGCRPDSSRAC
jgi:putative ABC transport system substrate-binding protein